MLPVRPSAEWRYFSIWVARVLPPEVRAEAEHLADLRQRRLGEATPVHRRVEVGAFVIEQVAVLDEQQALHRQRRQAGEVRVAPLRIAEVVDRHAAAIGDVQPGLGLFRVGREQPVFGVAHQRRGEVRLAGDGVVAVVQALHERRQQLVAEAAVEGPSAGNRMASLGPWRTS